MTEVARLIFKHSEKKHEDGSADSTDNSEICCLKELLGSIFSDMLDNIAFGKGNPNLVYKIIKETGPPHKRKFVIGVKINNKMLGKGAGDNKKQAEQKAAKSTLFKYFRKYLNETAVFKNQ